LLASVYPAGKEREEELGMAIVHIPGLPLEKLIENRQK
jgi:hypothetical protein